MNINIGGQKLSNLLRCDKTWNTIDINPSSDFPCNIANEKLPFKDNSIDNIYTSHTLEHILPHRQKFVYDEMYRVLKPNGNIRIVVPDADIAIQKYINRDYDFFNHKNAPSKQEGTPDLPICYLNGFLFTYRINRNSMNLGGHVIAYNRELAEYYLKQSGFQDIVISKYNTDIENFKGLDLEKHKKYSLYINAKKH